VATYPGKPPNPLGIKVEINLNGVWTDITAFVMLRDQVRISNAGRTDESGSISASQLTLTLKNDGRFTPKNSGGAYYPNLVRNTPVRLSVNATSSTGVAYNQFRFFGEVSSWPPLFDVSQRDKYVTVTAAGIWRRIQQASVPIGSAYSRYVLLATGSAAPQAYWAMEDGANPSAFVLSDGTGTNMGFTSAPSFAADGTSFPGSDALPQFNGSRITANVSGGTPTNNVLRFALSVPATGDSALTSGVAAVLNFQTAGTIHTVNITMDTAWKLTITGRNASNTVLFSTLLSQALNGTPVIVSVEFTPSGGNVAWKMQVIKPGAGAALASVSGSVTTASVGAVSFVTLNGNGILTEVAAGQMGVWYASVPAIASDASAINGFSGETTVARFQRLCAESNIATTVIGTGAVTMGPQVDDSISAVLQEIEATEGGLLYETRDQLGLGFRTLASMQNQAAAVTVAYTANVLGDVPVPTYDDALLRNSVTATNYDGYAALAVLTSGACSTQPPPNGVGQGYSGSVTVRAGSHAQVNAIAQQQLTQGCVDEVRFPTLTFSFLRSQAAPFFSSVPSLRLGDRLDLTSLPAFLGGSSTRQLIWGYEETMGGEGQEWRIVYNTIPELPFETAFSPGTFSVTQATSGAVSSSSQIVSTVSGSQIGGQLPSGALPQAISARTIGGITQFIAAATPFNWTFAVSGTPADVTYFICTSAQAQNISVGDTFTNNGGHGGPFTVNGISASFGGFTNVSFTPDAASVMSTGTNTGGKNGDTWVNTSGGNQVNQWSGGAWVPITWNAANVIQAASITATQIAASTITAAQIAAGIVIAGIVDGTLIIGAKVETSATNPAVQMDGARDSIFAYDGSSNLLFSLAGASGTDSFLNPYPAGAYLQQLTLDNQAGSPTAFSGASVFYSSVTGRPRYLNSAGSDSVLERSAVNTAQFTAGNVTTPTAISALMNIQANEGDQSSEYEIEACGSAAFGTAANHNLDFRLFKDGSAYATAGTNLNAMTLSNAIVGTGISIAYVVTFRVTYTGSSLANLEATGFWRDLNATTLSATNTGTMGGNAQGLAWDPAISHTLEIRASWGASQAGQTLTTYRTKLARRM
jgi:hypothetical protein